jgi:DNA repair protein RecN (Recombination protein N)
MLSSLRIKNFALIDRLEIEFGPGLNVLTGETGAGKSIVLDAIDLVLGGKANSRAIRQGSQQATIEATFKASDSIIDWLKEQEIEILEEREIICSRELTIAKDSLRSRSRVNGTLVNRQIIGKLRDSLVEITAQGQTVQLMISELQRQLLDMYGGKELLKQRQLVADAYEQHQAAKQALEKRIQSEQQRSQRLDFLEYQLKELDEAQLGAADELEQLEQERDRLLHVVELQQLSYQAYQRLYQSDRDESAATDILAEAEATLMDMVRYDASLEPILEIVSNAIAQVTEAGYQINAYGESLEADPERLSEVEERIATLKRICRKYGTNLAEAIAYYHQLQQELAELTDNQQSIASLETEAQAKKQALEKACANLTQLRQTAATKLEKQLVKELKPLAMDKVVFECQISSINPSAAGADRVVFCFSPNPGEAVQPISSIASGGEMSRFLLALKACFSNSEHGSQTLIFDEIDAGVSGKVAEAIAQKLHQLSQQDQVLCVTHQPLVAAMADTHFRVEKHIVEETVRVQENGQTILPEIRTIVRITQLDNHQTRKEELAQLTGGNSAQDAIAFAESLLAKAEIHLAEGRKKRNKS